MGSETSREEEVSSHPNGSQMDSIDVATYEAEMSKMREISRMDRAIRTRLQHGVKYNMRIVICGDKATGKTLLWKRFQGQAFETEHIPTPEIQSATIDWTSPSASNGDSSSTPLRSISSGDVVKVDVWDVVDKAINTDKNSLNRHSTADLVHNPNFTSGELGVSEGKHTLKLLDSSVVDIYKDAHAVIFMMDPHSKRSLQYVRDKYPLVPEHISILLVLNFRDKVKASASPHRPAHAQAQAYTQPGDTSQEQQQQVSLQRVQSLAAEIRSYRSNQANDDVTVLETSLRDCYGLLHLHHYLDVPFLRLKQKSLQEQLALVEGDLHSCHAHINDTVRLSNYEEYLRQYEARKRERLLQQQQSSHGGEGTPGAGVTSDAAPSLPPPAPAPAPAVAQPNTTGALSHNSNSNNTNYGQVPPSPPNTSLNTNFSDTSSSHAGAVDAHKASSFTSGSSSTATSSPLRLSAGIPNHNANTNTNTSAHNSSASSRTNVDCGARAAATPVGAQTSSGAFNNAATATVAAVIAATAAETEAGDVGESGRPRLSSEALGSHLNSTSTAAAAAEDQGQDEGEGAGGTGGIEGFLAQDDSDQEQTPASAPVSATISNDPNTDVNARKSGTVLRNNSNNRNSNLVDSDSEDSDGGPAGNSRLAQKVGFGSKSLSAVRENKQRSGGLVRPLRKARPSNHSASASASACSGVGAVGVEQETDRTSTDI